MRSGSVLDAIRDIIQQDVNQRGLCADPADNLITACPGDFAAAAESLADCASPTVGILTGFYIPHAQPPCGETDGPLGAVFLARAFAGLGFRVVLYTDGFCKRALEVGLDASDTRGLARVVTVLPNLTPDLAGQQIDSDQLSHLIAIERVGPGHSAASIRAQGGNDADAVHRFELEVPLAERDRLRNMRGLDISHLMAPGHLLVEAANERADQITTIGVGDGGNEIGMGKIPWAVIQKNIARGGRIACRVPTTHLIVAGISNWGAYGLAFAVTLLRQGKWTELLSEVKEQSILQAMVEQGPLVDGVTGTQTISVDGLPFERYAGPLRNFQALAAGQP
jgi:D-glutamate cyclase